MPLDSLLQRLRGLPAPDEQSWRPRIFDLSRPEDAAALEAAIEAGAVRSVHDTFEIALGDLLEERDPAGRWTDARRQEAVRAALGSTPPAQAGRWVLYPWSGRLAHLLAADELYELRSARNRYKITRPEQDALRRKRVGVVGLSVGQSAAITLAREGVGGRFHLADLDHLSLANMNRLSACAADLGLSKAVLAARLIFELDPYLDVRIFPAGLREDNAAAFFGDDDGSLDLVVEECDDLSLKVRVREEAARRRIPLVMDTSDRGMLDIERYDLQPDRPPFHGLAGDLQADSLRGLSAADKTPIVLAIIGAERMSARMAASLPEVDETVGSWPQLASEVALGGALVATAARRILLGQHRRSGRFYVDVEAILDGPAVEGPAPEEPPRAPQGPAAPLAPPAAPEAVLALVEAAIQAPTAHNAQPWRFSWDGAALELRRDPARSLPWLDFDDSAAVTGLGAALENLLLAAEGRGLRAQVQEFPDEADPLLVARITLQPGQAPAAPPPLLDRIGQRLTNRKRGERRPLSPAEQRALEEEAALRGARLRLLQAEDELERVGDLMGQAERIAFLHPGYHRTIFHGFRWSDAEARASRDGLPVSSLELRSTEAAGLKVLSRPEVAATLRSFGGGRVLETGTRQAVRASAAVGLLTVPEGWAWPSFLRGGRAAQRLWLRATDLGLDLHPMLTLTYLVARMERLGGEGLEGEEAEKARRLVAPYRSLFPGEGDQAEALLFRLHHAPGPPTSRALRRPVSAVLDLR